MNYLSRLLFFIFSLTVSLEAGLPKSFYSFEREYQSVSNQFGVPILLLKAVTLTENHKFKYDIKRENTNDTFDYGLMQINSLWLKEFKLSEAQLLNPYFNIQAGGRILSKLIKRHGYNWSSIGRYHSSTLKLKEKWIKRVKENIKYIIKHDKRKVYRVREG